MPLAFFATLGQRPEAITIAFERLSERYAYDQFTLLHTDPQISGIADAFARVQQVVPELFPGVTMRHHEMVHEDGRPIIDLTDYLSATAYFNAVLSVLHHYKRTDWRIHLLVAGGRKAMSIYALLAASRVFDPPHDHVWTILSDSSLVNQRNVFQIPAGMREAVQIVDLPLLPARLAPGADPHALRSRSRSEAFTAKLSPQEKVLTDLLRQNPYSSNEQLASQLHKSPKTIENQLRHIYSKLIGFLEFGEEIPDSAKRLALLDVLRDE